MGVGGQHHAPAAFTPRERPGTHCTEGWVGLGAGLDTCGKSRPHRDSIPRTFPYSTYNIPMRLLRLHSFLCRKSKTPKRRWTDVVCFQTETCKRNP